MPVWCLETNDKRVGSLEMDDGPITIGRHPDNVLVVKDQLSSRFHCVIEPDGSGHYRLKDLGSRNGTRLNGQRISEVLLSDGDVITIGKFMASVTAKESKQERRAVARAKSKATDPVWAVDLREMIETLPPKAAVDEAIILIGASGKSNNVLASDADGAKAMRLLLLLASKARATDIHLEPKGDAMAVRMRVDGQMVAIIDLPNQAGELVMGMVKTACEMKQAARDAVHDGHFGARFQDRRVDFRASLTPTVHGQKLVLRVLDSRTAPQSLDELHMPAYMDQRIKRVCEQDAGLLMMAGPTGSGKTTTLYNAIREIDRDVRNVITIEDPVEYHIEGVTQIPVSQNASFDALLRSVLRQDPDVILVGEIRDQETARTAMRAAMTGHVVFTTVHARDTIGAIFRILDLGVEPYLVANSCDVIFAQRLVRVLCDSCKRDVRVTPGQSTRIGRYLEGRTHTYAPTGCPQCLRTGFKGRRALFEMLDFNDELRDTILTNPTIHAIKRIIEQGVFTTLIQSGWLMAAKGETSLDEVDRVCGSSAAR